jgi:hypothetical protein
MRIDVKSLGLSVVVAVALSACGGGEMVDEGQDGLSTSTKTYIVLRNDARKCAAPACGGYFIRDANKPGSAETYVAQLDLSNTGFSDEDAAKVMGAPASELLLYGKLGKLDSRKVRAFLVYAAYRGMPGVAPTAGDTLFTATAKSVSCVAAPCLNQVATPLSGAAARPFSTYSVEGAAQAFVDQQWLTAQVAHHGAIVAGSIVQGAQQAAGADQVLAASQVFLKLPNGMSPCVKAPINLNCGADEVVTYVRDENRCLMPDKCVKPGVCSAMRPACGDGYTLQSWTAAPNGCEVAACDPTFSL